MRILKIQSAVLRVVGVVSAVGVLVTGVTFAMLQSQQAVLSGNTIQSATADLRIGTSASSFTSSRGGFDFKDVIPGGSAMPADGHTVYLKNYGTAALSLRVAGGGALTNSAGVDLSKVKLQMVRVDTGSEQTVDVQTLATTGLALTDPIAPSAVVQYKLRVAMDADAFTGASAAIDGIDLVYSGTADVAAR